MDIACVKSVLHTTDVIAQHQGSDSSDTLPSQLRGLPHASCTLTATITPAQMLYLKFS